MTNNDPTDINLLSETELTKIIAYHNQRYWEQGEPEISDERYDEFMRQLEILNPEHALVNAVNAPQVESSGKVTHTKPMLSLNKAYSLDEIITWADKYIRSNSELFIIQPKYDGISANYSNGILATRGDGFNGENISDKLPLIELEAKDYKGPVNRPVRGEIVIRNDDFSTLYANITRKGGGKYKNSRNAVAGIMGLKDISDMRRQQAKLTLVDYEMISYEVTYAKLRERWPQIIEEIEQLPYPMDGIVIKFGDSAYGASLGNTAHHPRSQIAFKFSGIRRESTLLNVEWSFGKNCLTPVAEIEPVDIGGITIRHATLHNAQNIIDKALCIGDRVVVERAGDVIPYIISSMPGKERRDAMIIHCPCCEHELIRSGPELCCNNPECFETQVQRLTAAVKSIGIERLGEPNIRRMMQSLKISNLKDIFDLTREKILTLEGFKEKSADNLLKEINTARNVTDSQLLAALNIPNIGKNIAKMILAEYTLNELKSLSVEQLSEINGIGPERAEALNRELLAQAEFLTELSSCVNVKQTKGGTAKPTICFTGKMPEKRSFYENMARQGGFEPVSAVNKELTLLIALNPEAGGGKLTKAAKAGVKIVALEKWLENPGVTDISAPVPSDSSDKTPQQVEVEFNFDF
ncbi:MAG: helix-hairpin-helix domain-containing protein [Victivallaceae bacterium]|nr:helix-hairpin-helix domain-containing protein [Victivallaceae bacterium]